MAILAFLLGAILVGCGFAALAMSVNLVPTEMGMLYAVSGVIFLSASAVVLAIGGLIVRVDRAAAPPRKPRAEPAPPETAPTAAPAEPTPPAPAEDEINFNRRVHPPILREIEAAMAEAEGQPQIVGRYAAGGVKYLIFSDGAIEAETDEGAFRFASLGEFKSFIANRRP